VQIPLAGVAVTTDPGGRGIIRGRIEGWVAERLAARAGAGNLHIALVDPLGQVQERFQIITRESAGLPEGEGLTGISGGNAAGDAAAAPQRISNWRFGRQIRFHGRWVYVHDDGSFDIRLPPEAKTAGAPLRLALIDERGTVKEQPMPLDLTVAEAAPAAGGDRRREGRKVALMFANTDYRQEAIPDLGTPAKDAALIGQTLRSRFGFETTVIANATKQQMVRALWRMHSELGEQDQLVIYYAGHGYEVEKTATGYWLPVDATTDSARNWLSTKDVARLLARIPARQIMVIADSCYSGAFTKEQKIGGGGAADLAALKDRRGVIAFSSGGDEPVLDGEVNSPFARVLANRLGEVGTHAVGEDLFRKVRADVTASTPQTPHYGAIATAGYDDGADFFFEAARREISAR